MSEFQGWQLRGDQRMDKTIILYLSMYKEKNIMYNLEKRNKHGAILFIDAKKLILAVLKMVV